MSNREVVKSLKTKMNIIVIVSDTLRASDLGCYGNRVVRTPCIDALARRSVRFTRAYPESLPTIPVRRALHTGRRAFPFRNYQPVKWDIVYLPGWQAMDNNEDTVAENLAAAGYQTGFVTDTLPYFAPGFNFTRGFWQWEFVRGQQQDRWKSPYTLSDSRLALYGNVTELRRDIHQLVPMHLANTAHVRTEQDTTTARVFQWATQFLSDNRNGQPFYLLVDCFDPHEPWEAPDPYYRMYGDANYTGRRIVHCAYGPADEAGYTKAEVDYVRAQYLGLVTLVDTWLGKLCRQLDDLGLAENTAVFLISDHGTNFCDNPRNIIGKPAISMYPGLMQLPFLARLPQETGAGTVCESLVYNIDLMATVYDLAGIRSPQEIHGRSLLPLIFRSSGWTPRQYLTCQYSKSVWYMDDQIWAIGDYDGECQEVFDLTSDPHCMIPLAGERARSLWSNAWQRLLEDADGFFPDYRDHPLRTDAIGQKPVE